MAVDRILTSLYEHEFNDMVRVGSIKKIAKPILPFTCQVKQQDNQDLKELQAMRNDVNLTEQDRKHVDQAIFRFKNNENYFNCQQAFVVGTTCLSACSDALNDIKCPIMILDECSQLTEPMAMLPILRLDAQVVLLVGDPLQLAPTLPYSLSTALQGKQGLERSIFQRLAHQGWHEPILLSTQYRCHPMISQISNLFFYQNRLDNGPNTNRPALLDLEPLNLVTVPGKQVSNGSSHGNFQEAIFITETIQWMLNQNIDPKNIGVIALYKGQVGLIQNQFQQCNISPSLLISTVDAFQGAEKEIIILSLVREESSSFLQETTRINVALTRAKRHLIIVCSETLIQQQGLWKSISEKFCSPMTSFSFKHRHHI